MRARLDDVARDGDALRLTLSAEAGVDRRSLVYLPRSDLFGEPRVIADPEGGHRLVVAVPVRHLYFPLGTDVHGRDLLTRCLVAGRVSLLIGLTATLVALLIGVGYGATAGFIGGAVDAEAVHDQVVRRDRDDSTVAAFHDAAPGVTVLDSTDLNLEQVVDAICALVPPAFDPVVAR